MSIDPALVGQVRKRFMALRLEVDSSIVDDIENAFNDLLASIIQPTPHQPVDMSETIGDLLSTATMLDRQAADYFSKGDNGKVHFIRAIMESASDSIRMAIDAIHSSTTGESVAVAAHGESQPKRESGRETISALQNLRWAVEKINYLPTKTKTAGITKSRILELIAVAITQIEGGK